MNPVFVLIVIVSAVILWFLLSFTFKPIGRLFYRLWKNAVDEMNNEEIVDKNE